MAETGWPLIPREVLPAPVPAARVARRRPSAPHDPGRQLSIFGAETAEPSPLDLAGLLAGPGRLGRMGGTARVSVRVDAAWRVHVLVAELVIRGLAVSWFPVTGDDPAKRNVGAGGERDLLAGERDGRGGHDPAVRDGGGEHDPPAGERDGGKRDGGNEVVPRTSADTRPPGVAGDGRPAGVPIFEVRTAYSSRLNGLARGWPPATHQLFLDGPRLRLWVAAAGEPRPEGYALGLGPGGPGLDPGTPGPGPGKNELGEDHEVIDAALIAAGLAGTLSDGGRCYLISGRRRLARLAELVGDPPDAAPPGVWPAAATA